MSDWVCVMCFYRSALPNAPDVVVVIYIRNLECLVFDPQRRRSNDLDHLVDAYGLQRLEMAVPLRRLCPTLPKFRDLSHFEYFSALVQQQYNAEMCVTVRYDAMNHSTACVCRYGISLKTATKFRSSVRVIFKKMLTAAAFAPLPLFVI